MVGRARRAVWLGSAGLDSQDPHSRHEREGADPSPARWIRRRPISAYHASGWQTVRRSEHARPQSARRQPRPVISPLVGIDALSASWPGLYRPSTPCLLKQDKKDVDARDK